MRDSIKQVFTHQVVSEEGSVFYYSVFLYELKDALENSTAILQEYNLSKKGVENGGCACKLYKTKDRIWYDFEDSKSTIEKGILRLLKSAIDAKENNEIAGI